MTGLPMLPFWTRYMLEAERVQAELDLGRTIEPYHLLVLGLDMLPYLARADTMRRAGMTHTAYERRLSSIAPAPNRPARQRVRREP